MSMLDVLRNGRLRRFRLNQTVQLSQTTRQTLINCCDEAEMNETEFQKHLDFILPKLSRQQRKEITDVAAIAAYWADIDTRGGAVSPSRV